MLKQYLKHTENDAERFSLDQSCHFVNEAAKAVGGSPGDLVKNICILRDWHFPQNSFLL